jgi:hypothetical protein
MEVKIIVKAKINLNRISVISTFITSHTISGSGLNSAIGISEIFIYATWKYWIHELELVKSRYGFS